LIAWLPYPASRTETQAIRHDLATAQQRIAMVEFAVQDSKATHTLDLEIVSNQQDNKSNLEGEYKYRSSDESYDADAKFLSPRNNTLVADALAMTTLRYIL
jgi:hypothetical protein